VNLTITIADEDDSINIEQADPDTGSTSEQSAPSQDTSDVSPPTEAETIEAPPEFQPSPADRSAEERGHASERPNRGSEMGDQSGTDHEEPGDAIPAPHQFQPSHVS
jgi:hypothetical protein